MAFLPVIIVQCDECEGFLALISATVDAPTGSMFPIQTATVWGVRRFEEHACRFHGVELEREHLAASAAREAGWFVTSTQCVCAECQ